MAKEYIEREILFNTLKLAAKASDAMGRHDSAGIYASAASLVDEQPAADVVEVVRCKDCRFYAIKQSSLCDMHNTAVNAEDYCSYGTKMDGGEHHAD